MPPRPTAELAPFGRESGPLQAARNTYTTTQAPERADILNVGGFCDRTFEIVMTCLDEDAAPERRMTRSDCYGRSIVKAADSIRDPTLSRVGRERSGIVSSSDST